MSTIPEEEWSLLTNALAEPIEQMIAVETTDTDQMREVECRLLGLAGTRPLLRQAVQIGQRRPEAVWRNARELTTSADLPLLLVTVDSWPENPEQRRLLAEFWRGMNQLRENWHALPAQVLFLLSPAAFEHLTLNADHLKSWISLKLRLWQGANDMAVLARPGTPQRPDYPLPETAANDESRRRQLELLHRQAEIALGRGEDPDRLARYYYLPLISGYLAMGDKAKAADWRDKIEPTWRLEQHEVRKLRRIDEQMASLNGKPCDVFLSHHPRDRIDELKTALTARNLTVWPDQDELFSDPAWVTEIEAGLQAAAAAALCLGSTETVPWEDEEMQTALKRLVRAKKAVIPVLLPGAPGPAKLPEFLGDRSWVDLRQGYTRKGLDRLVWGITGHKPSIEDFLLECRNYPDFQASDKQTCLQEFEELLKQPFLTYNKKTQVKNLLEDWLDAGISESDIRPFRDLYQRHFPRDGD